MDADEATRLCDELHACIDQGPGENSEALARALGALRRLREEAAWDYPITITMKIELLLVRWFSLQPWRDSNEQRRCRENLLDQISRLEDAWDRPRA